MQRIGIRRYKCAVGEVITIKFKPNPAACIEKIIFDFLNDGNDPRRVENNEIQFTFNQATSLAVFYFFEPTAVNGVCGVTLSGSEEGSSPDLIHFDDAPVNPIYRFEA
ncbi:MAG: hypothetical protein WA584_16015 [Pyrinomonadaceae bacterium]